MTVIPEQTQRKPQLVEFFADRIAVSYNDGSLEIDADAAQEKPSEPRSVDVFINPKEFPENNLFIVSQERFRGIAQLWGPVREKLAQREELDHAQQSFNAFEGRARIIFGDFSEAVKRGTVRLQKNAQTQRYELIYRDPRITDRVVEHVFRLYGEAGKPFQTLSLEESDGLRASISHPEMLKPLRATLDPLYREYLKKNGR